MEVDPVFFLIELYSMSIFKLRLEKIIILELRLKKNPSSSLFARKHLFSLKTCTRTQTI